LKLNGTHNLVNAENVTILGTCVYTVKENTEDLIIASKEFGREKMLIKLSTSSRLEITMRNEVTI
jgi:hypothetical protein